MLKIIASMSLVLVTSVLGGCDPGPEPTTFRGRPVQTSGPGSGGGSGCEPSTETYYGSTGATGCAEAEAGVLTETVMATDTNTDTDTAGDNACASGAPNVVLWARTVVASNADNPENARGIPGDDAAGVVWENSDYLKVGDFSGGFHAGLADVLGVDEAVLAQADVIAFEANGPNEPQEFENSWWWFSDGVGNVSVYHDDRPDHDPPEVVASGAIDTAAYSMFFGESDPAAINYSFVLLSVPATVDITSPSFTIRLGGLNILDTVGSPNPTGIGILARAR